MGRSRGTVSPPSNTYPSFSKRFLRSVALAKYSSSFCRVAVERSSATLDAGVVLTPRKYRKQSFTPAAFARHVYGVPMTWERFIPFTSKITLFIDTVPLVLSSISLPTSTRLTQRSRE